jgi:adenylate kinase family enzyme
MDGNYGGTLMLRLSAADTVIFLDFPTWVCLGRVLLRVIRSLGRTREDMAPGCPERFDLSFLGYVWRYRREDRSRHLAAVAALGGRLIILHRPAEVAHLVLGLSAKARMGSLRQGGPKPSPKRQRVDTRGQRLRCYERWTSSIR